MILLLLFLSSKFNKNLFPKFLPKILSNLCNFFYFFMFILEKNGVFMFKKITILLSFLFLFNNANKIICEELPPGFPQITIHTKTNPSPGYLFFNSFQFGNPQSNYNIITDSAGNLFKYNKPIPAGFDFKMNANGTFSYAIPIALASKYQQGPFLVQNFYVAYVVTDTNFKIIDQVQMQNGYLADLHEFVYLPNGHYLMLAYAEVPTDMSLLIQGGDPNAVVVSTVLQELDKDKNCIFEWSSLNHIPLFDTFGDLRKNSIEHVHGNSIFVDTDGNWIVSFASTCEAIKLNPISGEILWRFGGKKNQFKITNDNEADAPLYFSLQHDVHKLDNGNLLMFDNGYMRKNKYSRAVEYKFDEEKKTAEMVWEYRSNPDIFAVAMGSARRQKNGNTLINWGLMASPYQRSITEVDKDNNIVFEMSLPTNTFSYRAIKYNYPICKPVADVDKYELRAGNTYNFFEKEENTGISLKINALDAFIYNIVNVKKMECAPQNPEFDGEVPEVLPLRWVVSGNQVNAINADLSINGNTIMKIMTPEKYSIYYREKEGSGKFIKLPTTFDKLKNTYTANIKGFGEILLCLERQVEKLLPPHPLTPVNQKKIAFGVPFNLKWNPSSRYEKFSLQIASDETFKSIILDTTIDRRTSIPNLFTEKKKYYWKVKTHYKGVESPWSETFSYEIGEPFLTMSTPNGGETYQWDSTIIIRWNTNLPDTVRISLYDGDKLVMVIADSLKSYSSAFKWTIPSSIPVGYNYKIKVESKNNAQFSTMSQNPFTILDLTRIEIDNVLMSSIKGYPNPSSEQMYLSLDVIQPDHYTINIYSVLGKKLQTVFDGYLETGKHNFIIDLQKLSKGVYFYEVKMGNFAKIDKIVVE